jgi:RNA-splicing ligase RtcB
MTRFTLDDHAKPTGVECRKDAEVIDETPMAYQSIDAVMEAKHELLTWYTRCARFSSKTFSAMVRLVCMRIMLKYW